MEKKGLRKTKIPRQMVIRFYKFENLKITPQFRLIYEIEVLSSYWGVNMNLFWSSWYMRSLFSKHAFWKGGVKK
jgi:hypothetical protein